MTPHPLCTFPGCTRPHDGGSYCAGHRRQLSQGRALAPLRGRVAKLENEPGWWLAKLDAMAERAEREKPLFEEGGETSPPDHTPEARP